MIRLALIIAALAALAAHVLGHASPQLQVAFGPQLPALVPLPDGGAGGVTIVAPEQGASDGSVVIVAPGGRP